MKPQEGERLESRESQPLLPTRHPASAESTWRVLAACVGFLADSYDLFTIDIVVLILQLEHGEELVSAQAKSMMVSAMLAGVVIGQLSFGYIADWLGRKWSFVTTAALTILGALSCALCSGAPIQMSVCRFFLGLGVGGEYPLSATVTAETMTDANRRGRAMALVVSMQGFGMLTSAMMAMLLLSMPVSLEAIWRFLLGFGAVPSAIAFCMRWSLTESAIFENSRHKEVDGKVYAQRQMFDIASGCWLSLLGTASTWLLMNMFAYSLGSFKSTIFNAVIHTSSLAPAAEVFQHAKFAALTSCFAIVGFGAGFCLISATSRYAMQLYGFLAIAAVFFVVAGLLSLSGNPPVLLHVGALGFMFLFLNAGPNLTTYIIPAEIFPTCVRASCHGMSAASGKVGAFIGTAVFPLLQRSYGMEFVYSASGVLSLAAALITFHVTPREAFTLEELDAPSEKSVA